MFETFFQFAVFQITGNYYKKFFFRTDQYDGAKEGQVMLLIIFMHTNHN